MQEADRVAERRRVRRAKDLRKGGRARRDVDGHELLLAWMVFGRGRGDDAEGSVTVTWEVVVEERLTGVDAVSD